MKIATGGAPADTADIRWHLEVIRHELRPPLGILDLAEGHAEAAGDAQLADALFSFRCSCYGEEIRDYLCFVIHLVQGRHLLRSLSACL